MTVRGALVAGGLALGALGVGGVVAWLWHSSMPPAQLHEPVTAP